MDVPTKKHNACKIDGEDRSEEEEDEFVLFPPQHRGEKDQGEIFHGGGDAKKNAGFSISPYRPRVHAERHEEKKNQVELPEPEIIDERQSAGEKNQRIAEPIFSVDLPEQVNDGNEYSEVEDSPASEGIDRRKPGERRHDKDGRRRKRRELSFLIQALSFDFVLEPIIVIECCEIFPLDEEF